MPQLLTLLEAPPGRDAEALRSAVVLLTILTLLGIIVVVVAMIIVSLRRRRRLRDDTEPRHRRRTRRKDPWREAGKRISAEATAPDTDTGPDDDADSASPGGDRR